MTSSSSSFGAFDDLDLTFADVTLGDGQRWTTWPESLPTERGPEPRPGWVVTTAGAVDTELGILKTGKEGDVFLVERGVPDEPAGHVVLAAKRYRDQDRRSFHRSAVYTEGRGTDNTRDMRALAKKTAYGRTVAAAQWSYAEFEALCRLWALGVPVPYPVQVTGSEVLMEFIGTGTVAAPRLAQCKERGPALHVLLDQTVEILRALVRAGFAHGDLSAYNLLVHDGRVVVIDLPQVVDLAANPQGFDLLHRDCVNVCDWFARRGVEFDVEALFAELVADAF